MSMEDRLAVICRIPFSALKTFGMNGQVLPSMKQSGEPAC